MTKKDVIEYCLTKKLVYEDYPFDDQTACMRIRVGGKTPIFVQVLADDRITVKCDMWEGEFYRQQFPKAVHRGYHCPKMQQPYWNTVLLDGQVDDNELRIMIDHAYMEVIKNLPQKAKKELDK